MEDIKAQSSSETEFQNLLETARGYEKAGDDDKAIENYQIIADKFPQSFSGWWGLFHLSSKADLLDRKKKRKEKLVPVSDDDTCLKKALSLANETQKASALDYIQHYNDYVEEYNSELNRKNKTLEPFKNWRSYILNHVCKFVAYTSKYEISIYAVIEKEFKYLVKVLDTEKSEEYTYGMYGSLIDEGISCVSGSDYDNNVYATISFDEMTEKQDIIAHFYFDIDKYEDKIVFREYPDEELQKKMTKKRFMR